MHSLFASTDDWDDLLSGFESGWLTGAEMGERRRSPDGAPPFAGIVEGVGAGAHPSRLPLRLDEPAPGVASLSAHTMCGCQVFVAASFYFYGDGAAATVERAEPVWQAWMQERFPFPAAPENAGS